jgi:hypothetical protein
MMMKNTRLAVATKRLALKKQTSMLLPVNGAETAAIGTLLSLHFS